MQFSKADIYQIETIKPLQFDNSLSLQKNVCELQEAAMENIREVMEHEKEKFLIVKSHFKAISKPESQPTSISNKNNFTAHSQTTDISYSLLAECLNEADLLYEQVNQQLSFVYNDCIQAIS